ncbi:unnamed protein product, partial [Dovyalis caffra]
IELPPKTLKKLPLRHTHVGRHLPISPNLVFHHDDLLHPLSSNPPNISHLTDSLPFTNIPLKAKYLTDLSTTIINNGD